MAWKISAASWICLALASAATARDTEQSATLVDEAPAAPAFNQCLYGTQDGRRYSALATGRCPLLVEVDPASGEIRSPAVPQAVEPGRAASDAKIDGERESPHEAR